MDSAAAEGWALFGTVTAGAVGFAFAYLLVRMLLGNIRVAVSGQERTALVVVVATLALLALIGALLTSSESAWAFASLLGGALTASLTGVYKAGDSEVRYREPEGRSEPPVQPEEES